MAKVTDIRGVDTPFEGIVNNNSNKARSERDIARYEAVRKGAFDNSVRPEGARKSEKRGLKRKKVKKAMVAVALTAALFLGSTAGVRATTTARENNQIIAVAQDLGIVGDNSHYNIDYDYDGNRIVNTWYDNETIAETLNNYCEEYPEFAQEFIYLTETEMKTISSDTVDKNMSKVFDELHQRDDLNSTLSRVIGNGSWQEYQNGRDNDKMHDNIINNLEGINKVITEMRPGGISK